jgi:hypothetical protein
MKIKRRGIGAEVRSEKREDGAEKETGEEGNERTDWPLSDYPHVDPLAVHPHIHQICVGRDGQIDI